MFWKNKDFKVLARFFFGIFLVVFVLVNLPYVIRYSERVAMFLNYRVILAQFEGPNSLEENSFLTWLNKVEAREMSGSIFIEKIRVRAPLIFEENQAGMTDSQIRGLLDRGALFYDSSVLPPKPGSTIILGHSAPEGWPEIKYDNVFSDINDLENNDTITLEINNKQYIYSVFDKVILDKGGDLPEYTSLTNEKNVLMLVSCWPPGKKYKRIVVSAILQ